MINISSTAGLKGSANTSAYSASKAGLIALSESMMQEMRRQNIVLKFHKRAMLTSAAIFSTNP